MRQVFDAVIVGAGISGLVLARRLREKNKTVLILEKSRSVGGRMATRRDGAATYDHGAQFYKVQLNESFDLDELWSRFGYARSWLTEEDTILRNSEKGMNSLARVSALDLEILLNQKVTKILNKDDTTTEIFCDTGLTVITKKIYLTMPLPQTLQLLDESGIQYPADLQSVTYEQAIVGLFEINSQSQIINNLTHVKHVSDEIFSISNQQSKKVSAVLAFTAVMSGEWSKKNFEKSEADLADSIENTLSLYFQSLGADFSVTKKQIKKWKYSHPVSGYKEPYIKVGREENILLLGDGFGGGAIRGAVRSAESVDIN